MHVKYLFAKWKAKKKKKCLTFYSAQIFGLISLCGFCSTLISDIYLDTVEGMSKLLKIAAGCCMLSALNCSNVPLIALKMN